MFFKFCLVELFFLRFKKGYIRLRNIKNMTDINAFGIQVEDTQLEYNISCFVLILKSAAINNSYFRNFKLKN